MARRPPRGTLRHLRPPSEALKEPADPGSTLESIGKPHRKLFPQSLNEGPPPGVERLESRGGPAHKHARIYVRVQPGARARARAHWHGRWVHAAPHVGRVQPLGAHNVMCTAAGAPVSPSHHASAALDRWRHRFHYRSRAGAGLAVGGGVMFMPPAPCLFRIQNLMRYTGAHEDDLTDRGCAGRSWRVPVDARPPDLLGRDIDLGPRPVYRLGRTAVHPSHRTRDTTTVDFQADSRPQACSDHNYEPAGGGSPARGEHRAHLPQIGDNPAVHLVVLRRIHS